MEEKKLEFNGKIPMIGWLDMSQEQGSYGVLRIDIDIRKPIFDTLNIKNIEIPEEDCHISVFNTEEMAELDIIYNDAISIPEHNKNFIFTLNKIVSLNPEGWDEMERVWILQVKCEELENLREKYGFSRLMYETHEFHITFACKRKSLYEQLLTVAKDI